MSALEGHLHSKCFHVQLQVVSTKYILAHSSHAEGLSPVCNYHVDLQTLPLRELFCITSTYVSNHSSVSFNLYAVSSKKRINTFIITISSSCVPSFNFLSTTLFSSTTLLSSFSTSWYTTPSIYNPWHALEASQVPQLTCFWKLPRVGWGTWLDQYLNSCTKFHPNRYSCTKFHPNRTNFSLYLVILS